MTECGSCLWRKSCTTSELDDIDDLCDLFVDIENFYFESGSEEWLEFSYNKYTEGCLDTELSEYELFIW